MALLNLFRSAKTAPVYQGYIDARSTHHIAGWLRDLSDASRRLTYEVVLPGDSGERILHRGRADTFSAVLVAVGVGDGRYSFNVTYNQPVTAAERDVIFVRPAGAAHRLELAPELKVDPPGCDYQGYIDERSIRHVAGWIRDLDRPERRVEIEIVLPAAAGELVLARLVADQYNPVLSIIGIGDACYSFFSVFPRELTEAERDAVFVRAVDSSKQLELAPKLKTTFEPINHVAMDIVSNCNLRCPFCTYDYTGINKTELMTEDVFDSVLRLIPYVTDGNFWLSCLHEATLHPRLVEFIERVPAQYRKKLFFTTNLAKRMPRSFFEALATSGMSHFNISLESLDPAIYERMRKGARFRIFEENWANLLEVFRGHNDVPRIRYNIMAYRSNLHEIPSLAEFLLREKSASQVEIRNTFDGPQIGQDFRDKEFLTTAEWAWLEEHCSHFSPDDVLLLMPPGKLGYEEGYEPPPPYDGPPGYVKISPGPIPRPIHMNVSWKGMLLAYSEKPRLPGEPPTHHNYLYTNITTLEDPLATLFAL